MKTLFTIGYEKARPDAVMAELKRAKVKILVDTRAVAASRRAGFSKRMLAAALDEKGIAYIHLQKLGTPAEGREAARAGDLKKLWRVYAKHMKTAGAEEAFGELLTLIRAKEPVCLLCYERDPACCHRSKIADMVRAKMRVKVEDLMPSLL
jgi:uncharacterized protein (DUF488 family)